MSACSTHPDRDSLAACSVCGGEFCEECLETRSTPVVCTECAIADAGARVGRLEGAAKLHEVAAPARAARRGSWVRLIAGIGMIVVACEAATILLMKPPTATPGAGAVDSPEQARAIESAGKLFLVQAAVEAHRQQTGSLPADLAELAPLLPESVLMDVQRGDIAFDKSADGGFSLRSGGSPIVVDTAPADAPEEEKP